jgi:hypothetical protein
MKLTFLGVGATICIVILAILIIIPPYLQNDSSPSLITFSIITDSNLPQWCNEIFELLNQEKVSAILFISGEHAKLNPSCVSELPDFVEIGSQSHHFSDISKISDYSLQLQEVKEGKQIIDDIGNFESKAFKAPMGNTDDNIYSILDRSGILVDFSPKNQYNIYHDGKFIWFVVETIEADKDLPLKIKNALSNEKQIPLIFHFDNTIPISEVKETISILKENRLSLVTASDLVGQEIVSGKS